MDISIILRFHNEELYLPVVMDALVQQEFPSDKYEIIAVDNLSTDRSKHIASQYTGKVLSISDYRPGKALNEAIKQAKGDAIAIVSAHAIPANRGWLKTLYAHMNHSAVAGVYGAQLYPANSRFLDKRDLDIFSTLEPRVEKENSDLWNANSMFPRFLWERQRFDETTYELEDHYWTKQILSQGYEVHFEPNALVYHYSHISRIDREHLPDSTLSEPELMRDAIAELERNADWPTVMRAALTLSSLTHSPHIKLAVPALCKQLLTHEDFDVRWRSAQALGKIPDPASVECLIAALSDSSFYPRDEAAWSLARLGSLSVNSLSDRINEFPPETIPFAALALGRSGVKSAEECAVELLLTEIRSNDATRQRNAIYFGGEMLEASTIERLIPSINRLLESEDSRLSSVCCWALGCFAQRFEASIDWNTIQFLSKHHTDSSTRFEAVVALGKLTLVQPTPELLALLMSYLSDKESRVRYGAVQSIRLVVDDGGEMPVETELQNWRDEDFGVMYELALLKKMSNARQASRPERSNR